MSHLGAAAYRLLSIVHFAESHFELLAVTVIERRTYCGDELGFYAVVVLSRILSDVCFVVLK